jgi:hypothetical protein
VTYGFGRILAGFATGLLLVIGFPPEKLPVTVVFINVVFSALSVSVRYWVAWSQPGTPSVSSSAGSARST